MTLADYLLIAESVLGVDAGVMASNPHIVQLADSSLAVPQSGYGGIDFFATFEEKAAILCSRLARNHPLPDGNKRCAYLAMVEFIERNGRTWECADSPDEVADVLVRLASGMIPDTEFVGWVAQRLGMPAGPWPRAD